MVENRSSLFGIIAIIIGASGLGLGVFSVVNFQVMEGPQGPPGNDGQDGIDGTDGVNGIDAPGFYCSSESEINDALIIIGTGAGTIWIIEEITLSGTININGGGSYKIMGLAPSITIDCNGVLS